MNRRQAVRSLLGVAGALGLGFRGSPWAGVTSEGPDLQGGSRPFEPFEIDFSIEEIEDLHRRIDSVKWPEMPFDTGWSAGTADRILRDLVAYWRNEYDWFSVQTALNELTHLRGSIEGDLLHCVIYDRDNQEATGSSFPLLLLHGWPGSFYEFHEAAPRLSKGVDGDPGFKVVVPSLPGYVFSDAPSEIGMGPGRIAERLHQMMLLLGHEHYGVQAGDWGAIIATEMARMYPDSLVGLHLNFVFGAPSPPAGVGPSPDEVAYREAIARFQRNETGYSRIQGTRPQTLTYAQQDSPVGWLAWVLEKYWAWSEHGDDLWETFSRDDILTTAMLYWLPGRILSAARLYYESSNPLPGSRVGGRVEVPTGYARFPAEPWAPPRNVVERTYNLVHYSEPLHGGHFPALEQPVLWSGEVSRFFSSLRI